MIIKEKILDKEIYIESRNGNFSFDIFEIIDSSKYLDFDIIDPNFEEYKSDSCTFSINLSNSCNLRCDYCFNKEKNNKSIDLELVYGFLSTCFEKFKDKEKFFVDLSGKGEPLLFLTKILAIKKYCDNISNKLNKEVLVSFVCNGTLLNEEISSILQNHGILFGVSIDGNENIHDLHRKNIHGEGTYKGIINNVNSIASHEYVGCASTLTKQVFDLKESIIELSKTFNTISYKPARKCEDSIDVYSIDLWKREYEKLTIFLLEESLKGNHKYIKTLLNGDDYFGKFLKRVILNKRCIIRCDGGLTRLTLNDDGKVYICPAACNEEQFQIGDYKKIDENMQINIYNLQKFRLECRDCSIKYICGGECLVEKSLSHGINTIMCKYKKHLSLLAIYFSYNLALKSPLNFKKLYMFCEEVINRGKSDEKLLKFITKNKRKHNCTFIEFKKIYDKKNKRY